jgi:Ferritin-like
MFQGQASAQPSAILTHLDELAAIEHALCVEYLLVQYALGPDADLAGTFEALAQDEMRHLHGANRFLVCIGREPRLDRATRLATEAAGEIALVPPSPAAQPIPAERLRAIATAVDRRYQNIRAAIDAGTTGLTDAELEQLGFALIPISDHLPPLADLSLDVSGLVAQPREPADPNETRLMHASDAYYRLVLGVLRAWFGDEEELGGLLRGHAVEAMAGLDEVNGLLVTRGLLPRFAA